MKTIIMVLVASFAIVTTFAQKSKADSAIKNSGTTLVHYTCSMHPEVVSDKPGNCPYCNAKLVVDRRGTKQGTVIYTCSMPPERYRNQGRRMSYLRHDAAGKSYSKR